MTEPWKYSIWKSGDWIGWFFGLTIVTALLAFCFYAIKMDEVKLLNQ